MFIKLHRVIHDVSFELDLINPKIIEIIVAIDRIISYSPLDLFGASTELKVDEMSNLGIYYVIETMEEVEQLIKEAGSNS